MSMPLQLVFYGELIEGFTADEVRRNLAQTFQLGDEQLDRMFGGKAVVLKRNLDDAEAERYVTRLASLGARAQMRAMPTAANTSTYRLEPSVLSPLPPLQAPLTASDGPLDPPDQPRHSDPASSSTGGEPMAPLRPTRSSTFSAEATTAPSHFDSSPIVPLPKVEEVVCPKCGERQPMRVLCRNCATNLEMAFADQAERRAVTRTDRIDAARARRGLPSSQFRSSQFRSSHHSGHAHSRLSADANQAEAPPLWGLGWQGRLGRSSYATGTFAMAAGLTLADVLARRMPVMLGSAFGLLAMVAVIAMSLRLAALRFHDRGLSGWWNLLWLFPLTLTAFAFASPTRAEGLMVLAGLVYVGIVVYLLFFPGEDGDNTYGGPAREGSEVALLVAALGCVALGAFAPDESALSARLRGTGGRVDVDVLERLRSGEARKAYVTEYLASPDQKAFAASPDGSWGWVSDARNIDDAMDQAMQTCEKHRPRTQRPCELIGVNGRAVPR